MNNNQKRILLFLGGCIVVRTIFVIIAKYINNDYLPYLGYLALLPAIGLLYYFISGTRTTGPEVFGDKIWWNNLRPIHAILYILFAISAIQKKTYSWVFLLIDVIFGLSAFLIHHFM
jgi:hypothetical protein